MRKNWIATITVAAMILLTSFTTKKDCVDVYLVYTSGSQCDRSSYTETTTAQPTQNGTTVLVWIRVCVPNGTITSAIFDCVIEGLDTDSDCSLDDETEKTITVTCTFEIEVQLEKGEV